MALLHEPEVLFLDEPTLGLDVLARRRILGFVREINRERQVTVVVTSHDMDELEQLSSRIVMLHRGAIAFDGDFAALRRASSDRRVLWLETAPAASPPALAGAERTGGENGRHEYVYDATQGPPLGPARAGRGADRRSSTSRPTARRSTTWSLISTRGGSGANARCRRRAPQRPGTGSS